MTAEEMFYKEGFTDVKHEDDTITYTNFYEDETSYDSIVFSDFNVSFISKNNSQVVYTILNKDVFKAIQKQIEELGWN